jgi:hypothetical protein
MLTSSLRATIRRHLTSGARFTTSYLTGAYDRKLAVPLGSVVMLATNVEANLRPAEMSVEVWYKWASADVSATTGLGLVDHYPYSSQVDPYYGIMLRMDYYSGAGGPGLYAYYGPCIGGITAGMNSSKLTPTSGAWIHLIATARSGDQSLYVNGTQVGTHTYAGTLTLHATDSRIGGSKNVPGLRVPPGELRLVKFHNRGLTAAEVSALYSAGAPA